MNVVRLEQTDLTLPDAAELAKTGTVILTKAGKPLAAIKDLSGTDWESVALAEDPRFRAVIEASRRAYQKLGGISLEDLRRELGLKAPRPRTSRRKKEA